MDLANNQVEDKILQEKIGWKPFPKQEKIINSDKRRVAVVAPRRWGKTDTVAYIALKQFFTPKSLIWVVAPIEEDTKRVINRINDWLRKFVDDSKLYQKKKRPHPHIESVWDSTIEGKTANSPQSLRGEEVDLLIVDEAAFIEEEVYQGCLVPVTIDRDAPTIMISTPAGKNWYHKFFLRLKEDPQGMALHGKVKDRPNYPMEFYKKYKKEYPEPIFKQEFEAEFVDSAGTVFRQNSLEEAVVTNYEQSPKKDHWYVIGADIATQTDFLVIVVYDAETNEPVATYRGQNISHPFIIKKIASLANKYNNARVIIDSSGKGEPIYDALWEEEVFVEGFHFTNPSKRKLIDNLRLMLEEKSLKIPQEALNEFESFAVEVTPSKIVKYSAPSGMHDDWVDAVGLAAWNLDKDLTKRKKTEKKPDTKLRQMIDKQSKKNKKHNTYI